MSCTLKGHGRLLPNSDSKVFPEPNQTDADRWLFVSFFSFREWTLKSNRKTWLICLLWLTLEENCWESILLKTRLNILPMAVVHGWLAIPVHNAEHLSICFRMVVKSWLVPAKVCTILKTKAVLGLSVAITLLRMAISFLCKRMVLNF